MTFYCEMKVNDTSNGELLERVNQVLGCDECESAEEFAKAHQEECYDILIEKLKGSYAKNAVVVRMDITALDDDFAEEEEDEENEEEIDE